MIRIKYIALIVFVLITLQGCGKRRAPQIPSNKIEPDTVALAMLEINQRLVQIADKELVNYVLESGKNYIQDDLGYWYIITKRKQGDLLKKDDIVTLHQKVILFDGKLSEDLITTAQIGKKQILAAVENALLLLTIGEKIEIIAPWYLAYGQNGNGVDIGAYTNIIIELEVLEE